MKDYNTLASIILSTRNSAGSVTDCVKSLINQTYKNIEIIIIDDNSRDETLKILKKLKKSEKRLRIYENEKRYGLATTLNRGIKKAKGRYLSFMNQKDISSHYRIKKQVSFLMENPKVAAVGAQCRIINNKGKKIGESGFPTDHEHICQALPLGLSVLPETVLIDTRRLPKNLVHFSEISYPLFYSGLFVKIINYAKFANLPDLLYSRRKVSKRSSNKIGFYLALIKLWVKSILVYNYRPSLTSLFSL